MTMKPVMRYAEIKTSTPGYWSVLIALAVFAIIGFAAAHHMDVEGHHITGMSNQVVWGLPHVFAIFLIVAASGALNLASMASVFARQAYKPLARFSAILAIALLIGGLVILLLDLGRPERLIVAVTHYNFRSIFAWNIILYTGFIFIVMVYLWLMMERRMHRWSKSAGLLAFVWRLILTTGTGSIFGFLVAREAYDSALLAPMFIAMSFAFGLAVFILLLILSFRFDRRELDVSHLHRLRKLLGIFIAAVFYFVVVSHLSKLYGTQNHGFERFILAEGGSYTLLFWLVQIGLGNLLPLALIYAPRLQGSSSTLVIASVLVIIGAFAQLYIIIIGGQAFPLNIFPGYAVESSFFDGTINEYSPSLWELLLGLGGVTSATLIALLGVRLLPVMPESLPAETH